jgi:hypothetical protein
VEADVCRKESIAMVESCRLALCAYVEIEGRYSKIINTSTGMLTREEIEFKLFRHDQLRVDDSETPVEAADQALQGSRAHGEDILNLK